MKKTISAILHHIRRAGPLLLLLCMICSALSVALLLAMSLDETTAYLASVESHVPLVQAGAAGLGVLAALALSRADYHTLAKLWKLHLPVCVLLVLLTFTSAGMAVGDADDRAWIRLFGGIMSLQPTELLKISFILTFACHLAHVGAELNRLHNVLLLSAHAGALILLVHFQGDDGTALIFGIIFLSMMFVAGWSWWYLLLGGTLCVCAAPLVWMYVMNDDQRSRVLGLYLRGEDTERILYQQNHALVSIGSGQVVGSGLFSGDYSYVPSMRNDFIFSFIGNTLGFVGCMFVLLLLLGICVRILWTSHIALDSLGRLLCIGVFAMIASQVIVNIGMNLMLLPVIGVTLPLFSAGGTSVLSVYLGIGIVLSVSAHSKRHLFLDS